MERYLTDEQIALIRKIEDLQHSKKIEDVAHFNDEQEKLFLNLRGGLYGLIQYCNEYEQALQIGYQKAIVASVSIGAGGTGCASGSISFPLELSEIRTLISRKIEKVKSMYLELFPNDSLQNG